jgi:hypothetical protein
MRTFQPVIRVALLALLVSTVACGDSGNPSTSPSPTAPSTGSGVDVRTDRHKSGKALEIEGLITSIDTGTLVVNGTTINVPADAVVRRGHQRLTFTDLKVGQRVEVRGTPSGSTVMASEVKLEDEHRDDDDDDHDAKVEGAVGALAGSCPSLTFTVKATPVSTDAATRFKEGTCSQVTNGVRVEVKGVRQSNGSIKATRVELDEDKH